MPAKKTTATKTTSKASTTKKTTTKRTTTKKAAAPAKTTTVKKPAVKKAPSTTSAAKASTAAKKTAAKKPAAKAKPRKKVSDLNATVGSALGFNPYQQKKTEEYMSPEMLKHFEEILLFWKRQLMEEVDSTVIHMQEEAANLPDPVDRAALEEGFNLELRTRDRERKLIRKIEKSLDEIKEGDYGYCEDCGIEIGIRRLEARPTAAKCIDCKTYQEIREKQEGMK